MMATLFQQSVEWLRLTFWSPARQHPLRAAVLNTGELVLIDAHGNAQVLSVETTDMVRDVLDSSADIHAPIFPEARQGDNAQQASGSMPTTLMRRVRAVQAAGGK